MKQQQEQAAADAQNEANDQNRRALLAERDRARLDGERQAQANYEAAAAETNAYAMEHNKNMASMTALLGEGGGGVTAGRKFASMGVKDGQDMATLSANSTRNQAQISLNTASQMDSISSKIGSIKNVAGPGMAGTLLQIGGAGIGAAKEYKASKLADDAKLPKK